MAEKYKQTPQGILPFYSLFEQYLKLPAYNGIPRHIENIRFQITYV
jgi:hypothetical protein